MKKSEESLAVALKWDASLPSPVVLATGVQLRATDLISIAREFGIPVVDNPELASLLSVQEIGTCVPEECWQAVALVFAFLDEGIQRKWF